MFYFLIGCQHISIIVLMVNIIYILNRNSDSIQRDLLMLHIGMLVTIMSYTAEMQAKSIDVMKLAIKTSYIGKPIIIFSMFLLAVDYCRVELPNLIKTTLAAIQMIVIYVVYTFDSHNLFYTKLIYSEQGMFPHLEKEFGVIYTAYTVLLFVYAIATVCICMTYFFRTKNVKEKKICVMLAVITLIPFGGFAFYITGTSNGYDATILGYSIATCCFALIFRKFDVFETVNLATDNVIRYLDAGIVVYDEFGSLVHINNMARKMKVIDKVEKLYKSREYFFFEDKVYRVEKFPIENNGVLYGHVYYLDNETVNYHYEKSLREEKQRADAANSAKLFFFSSKSQDIRTPLNSILGMSRLAKLHIDEKERVEECLDKITTSGNTLLEIINGILNESDKKEE